MAIGLNGTAFFGAKTSQYDRIRFQEGLLLTANKTLWQASVDYLYEPFYGKIALFNRLLFTGRLTCRSVAVPSTRRTSPVSKRFTRPRTTTSRVS